MPSTLHMKLGLRVHWRLILFVFASRTAASQLFISTRKCILWLSMRTQVRSFLTVSHWIVFRSGTPFHGLCDRYIYFVMQFLLASMLILCIRQGWSRRRVLWIVMEPCSCRWLLRIISYELSYLHLHGLREVTSLLQRALFCHTHIRIWMLRVMMLQMPLTLTLIMSPTHRLPALHRTFNKKYAFSILTTCQSLVALIGLITTRWCMKRLPFLELKMLICWGSLTSQDP